MDDTISREAALKVCENYNGNGYVWSCIREDIGHLPIVEPEVIRCKDCKFYVDGWIHCNRVTWYNGENDFCSRAERRTDE